MLEQHLHPLDKKENTYSLHELSRQIGGLLSGTTLVIQERALEQELDVLSNENIFRETVVKPNIAVLNTLFQDNNFKQKTQAFETYVKNFTAYHNKALYREMDKKWSAVKIRTLLNIHHTQKQHLSAEDSDLYDSLESTISEISSIQATEQNNSLYARYATKRVSDVLEHLYNEWVDIDELYLAYEMAHWRKYDLVILMEGYDAASKSTPPDITKLQNKLKQIKTLDVDPLHNALNKSLDAFKKELTNYQVAETTWRARVREELNNKEYACLLTPPAHAIKANPRQIFQNTHNGIEFKDFADLPESSSQDDDQQGLSDGQKKNRSKEARVLYFCAKHVALTYSYQPDIEQLKKKLIRNTISRMSQAYFSDFLQQEKQNVKSVILAIKLMLVITEVLSRAQNEYSEIIREAQEKLNLKADEISRLIKLRDNIRHAVHDDDHEAILNANEVYKTFFAELAKKIDADKLNMIVDKSMQVTELEPACQALSLLNSMIQVGITEADILTTKKNLTSISPPVKNNFANKNNQIINKNNALTGPVVRPTPYHHYVLGGMGAAIGLGVMGVAGFFAVTALSISLPWVVGGLTLLTLFAAAPLLVVAAEKIVSSKPVKSLWSSIKGLFGGNKEKVTILSEQQPLIEPIIAPDKTSSIQSIGTELHNHQEIIGTASSELDINDIKSDIEVSIEIHDEEENSDNQTVRENVGELPVAKPESVPALNLAELTRKLSDSDSSTHSPRDSDDEMNVLGDEYVNDNTRLGSPPSTPESSRNSMSTLEGNKPGDKIQYEQIESWRKNKQTDQLPVDPLNRYGFHKPAITGNTGHEQELNNDVIVEPMNP